MALERFISSLGEIRAEISSPEKNGDKQVIYLSGMLGSGKTTIGSLIAQRVGGTLISESTEPIPSWVYVTRSEDSVEAKVAAQLWTLNQHELKDQRIKDLSGTIIVDRTWIDSLIYAVDFGEETVTRIAEETKKYQWEPGITLLLVVKPEVCKTRIMQRMKFTEEEWKDKWEPYVTRLYNTIVTVSQQTGIKLIDTSALTIDEVVDLVEAEMY